MKKRKLKILELTAFSAGICGVWARVLAESRILAKKNAVHVFSSDIFRGGEIKKAKEFEIIDRVKIHRFKTKGSFGDNTFFWNFEKEAIKLKPDVIVCHAYRQYYSTKALTIAKKLNIPCFLVTHAPFLKKKLRSWKLNLAVFLYDNFIGKRIINKYKKVLAITKWERPYLLDLGCQENRIVYVPNGIPEEFFNIPLKQRKNNKRILFFGRIAPIKNLEVLIKAFSMIEDEKAKLDLIGPQEKEYAKVLDKLISKLGQTNRIKFYPAVYNMRKKIDLMDNHDIFILPSKREGMPQALIEAMARKMIVISSKTDGGKEIIEEGKNGFLFEIGDERQLAEKINAALNLPNNSLIANMAREYVKMFSWKKLGKLITKTYLQ